MIRIWLEKNGDLFAVRWHSNGLTRIQTCATEDEARSFAAGMEEGLEEAQRVLSDYKPRLVNTLLQEKTSA